MMRSVWRELSRLHGGVCSALGSHGEHRTGPNDLLTVGSHGAVAEGQPAGELLDLGVGLQPGAGRPRSQVVRGQRDGGHGGLAVRRAPDRTPESKIHQRCQEAAHGRMGDIEVMIGDTHADHAVLRPDVKRTDVLREGAGVGQRLKSGGNVDSSSHLHSLPERSGEYGSRPYLLCVAELRIPSLADEIVVLRRWRETDVPAQLEAFRDPLFERFSDWAPHTEAGVLAYLAEEERARQAGKQIEFALVEPGDDDVVLGGASLNNVDLEQRRAAIGYWLTADARGRGVATHAVRLICRWAFDDLRLARLELTCGPDNRGSQGVAERCGFTREGVLRSHVPFKGGRRDTVVFSLLPGDLR
jgi:ribosomal-protein-alanine N-acetyltransferase